MKTNLKQLMTLMLFLVFFSGMAQSNFWKKTSERKIGNLKKVERNSSPKTYQLYYLDLEAFKQHLKNAPLRSKVSGKSTFIIKFPRPSGEFAAFRVTESPIMAKGLADKYPMIKTYSATGIDDPTATMRFSVTQFGLHTMALSGKTGQSMIDPYTENRKNYIVYNTATLPADENRFKCTTVEGGIPDQQTARNVEEFSVNADESKLRTYRLALSCNADYGNIFATNPGTEVEDIQAQMTIAINRVNEIYERDLAITLQFVDNNDELIYYGNSADDPWMGEYNSQTQVVIDDAIGDANYDIGHNFNTTGGGNAGCIGCVCVSGQKGSGYTGQSNPTGDAFYIDYVAHEMGHQFGAFHTMNTCSRSGNGSTEVEPASGSSAMSYAGICSTNVQAHSDAQFNFVSIRNIEENIQPGGNSTCGEQTDLENQPPTADAGDDYTIPKGTAFKLHGTASDPDGDETLTYNWAQDDPEQAPGNGAPSPYWQVGPLYRSIMPLDSPDRYMPRLDEVVNGNLTPTFEVTPSVGRTMNFSYVVRDNGSGFAMNIGQTASDLMTVTVDGGAGPFEVISQNEADIIWEAEETETVTWDVANTDGGDVNESNVDIMLSTDGGQTFDVALVENVPNNGSADITVPNNVTAQARLMVKASNNIFYAVNQSEFTIKNDLFTSTPDFESFKLYPNPNNGNFSVKFNPKSAEPVVIKVFDLNGRLIYNHQFKGATHFEQQINLDNAQSGLYMVRIKSGQQQLNKKIIVR